jgi:hypothetical protein
MAQDIANALLLRANLGVNLWTSSMLQAFRAIKIEPLHIHYVSLYMTFVA